MLRSVKAYAASLAVVDSVVEGKLASIGVLASGNVSEWVEKVGSTLWLNIFLACWWVQS